jgi:hypothetical protein
VTCDSGSPVLTARARREPAVSAAARTQHGPGPRLPRAWEAPRATPHGLILQVGGHADRPWLSMDDRCRPMLRARGGTVGEDNVARSLPAMGPARPEGEARPGDPSLVGRVTRCVVVRLTSIGSDRATSIDVYVSSAEHAAAGATSGCCRWGAGDGSDLDDSGFRRRIPCWAVAFLAS